MALINEQLIAKAKSKLPDAFTTTSSLAPPIRPAALPYHDHLMPIELYDNLDSSNNPLVPRDGDEADVAEAIRELGIEALPVFVTFHRPTVDGQCEIFYIGSRMRQVAALVARKLDLVPAEGWRVALEVVRRHEMFHFRFDLYALHQELTLARPLYNAYHENVYRKVFCTDSCFEEALANHLVITGVKHMSRAFGLSSTKLSEFLKSTYKNSPPGYSNFDDPLETLRGGLGGQILTGSTGSPLDEPQNVWVGSAGPFNRPSCSERVLISDAAASSSPCLQLRPKRRVW